MRNAVLFIMSIFIFSGCAHVTDKEFKHFTNEMKKVVRQNETVAQNHLKLTKENMDEIEVLKKQNAEMRIVIGRVLLGSYRLDQKTKSAFAILIKALENQKIKLDFEKAQKQLEEDLKNRLQEKSK